MTPTATWGTPSSSGSSSIDDSGFNQNPEIPRPLVYRVAALGDTILLTGLLRVLADNWGGPCDVIVKSPWDTSVLKGLDSVADILSIRSRRNWYWMSPGQQRLVRWLRRRNSGPTYVVDPIDKELWLLRRGGIRDEHMVIDRQAPWLPIDRHHYRFLLDFARYMPGRDGGEILSLPDPLPSPELRLFDDELAECRNWLTSMGWKGQPLIAFQTQARRKNKGRWPIEHWVTTVLAAIDTVPDSWGVLIGSQDEAKEVREIANRCDDPRVHCVAGEFRNLRRLFALLSLAHSCVSLDTGPAHAAVTLGCPSVVLFSTGHPRVYHPVGPDDLVQVVTAIPEHQWPGSVPEFAAVNLLSDIKPEAVLDAWQRLQHRQL